MTDPRRHDTDPRPPYGDGPGADSPLRRRTPGYEAYRNDSWPSRPGVSPGSFGQDRGPARAPCPGPIPSSTCRIRTGRTTIPRSAWTRRDRGPGAVTRAATMPRSVTQAAVIRPGVIRPGVTQAGATEAAAAGNGRIPGRPIPAGRAGTRLSSARPIPAGRAGTRAAPSRIPAGRAGTRATRAQPARAGATASRAGVTGTAGAGLSRTRAGRAGSLATQPRPAWAGAART